MMVFEEALQRLGATTPEAWERAHSLRHPGRAVAALAASSVQAFAAGDAGCQSRDPLGKDRLSGADARADDRAGAERGEVGRDGGRGRQGILEAVMTSDC